MLGSSSSAYLSGQFLKGFYRVSSWEKKNLGKPFLFTIDREERLPIEVTVTERVETLLDLSKFAHYFLSPSSLSLAKICLKLLRRF